MRKERLLSSMENYRGIWSKKPLFLENIIDVFE